MKNSRRRFIKYAGMAGLGLAGSGIPEVLGSYPESMVTSPINNPEMAEMIHPQPNQSVIGLYGRWASSLTENKNPFSIPG